MSRIFEDTLAAMTRFPWTASALPLLRMAKMEASETDKEVSIVTELPGVSAQDVDISLDGDLLTIRAEIKAGSTTEPDGKRDYHIVEREYGKVLRTFRLPFSPDPTQLEATLQNGLLTIRIAKPQAAQDRVRKIPVRAVGGGAEGTAQAARVKAASPSESVAASH